ncbi:hypothetical protein BJV74DRAFT_510708 [Russula compacta]|nr:hypothetical protein BJV74DRAFT_510708 [Russula compacta]
MLRHTGVVQESIAVHMVASVARSYREVPTPGVLPEIVLVEHLQRLEISRIRTASRSVPPRKTRSLDTLILVTRHFSPGTACKRLIGPSLFAHPPSYPTNVPICTVRTIASHSHCFTSSPPTMCKERQHAKGIEPGVFVPRDDFDKCIFPGALNVMWVLSARQASSANLVLARPMAWAAKQSLEIQNLEAAGRAFEGTGALVQTNVATSAPIVAGLRSVFFFSGFSMRFQVPSPHTREY